MRTRNPRFSEQGVRRLGQMIRAARKSKGWSLEYFANVIDFTEATTRRLEKGQIDRPQWDLVNAIALLGIIRNPATDLPFTANELMLIACEVIDSQTGQYRDSSMASQPPSFVAFLRSWMERHGISQGQLEQMVQERELPIQALHEIQAGRVPIEDYEIFVIGGCFAETGETYEFEQLRAIAGPAPQKQTPTPEEQGNGSHDHIGNGSTK
uniref:helix-turn-helix domain-containing protein n=1 Tax=Trichocoleus desertorum TaxID=1481672 RepID=UPI0025B56750|nr:helix-turn-helix transcriptional regulator [Trichocoleus desertorum]